jgi:alpha-glucosidase
VLSNHDVARHVSRLVRDRTVPGSSLQDLLDTPADLELGRRRARAAALLTLALPGGAYVYQGEELGLPEVEDLPEEVLEDPTWERSGHTDRGRDGCRVPLPWSGDRPPYGFGPEGGAAPWLPQPDDWAPLTVAAEQGDPGSMLELYRTALRLRRETPALGDGGLSWLDLGPGVLGFTRDPGFACVVNVAADEQPLPDGYDVVLASTGVDGAVLPRDAAAWLRRR